MNLPTMKARYTTFNSEKSYGIHNLLGEKVNELFGQQFAEGSYDSNIKLSRFYVHIWPVAEFQLCTLLGKRTYSTLYQINITHKSLHGMKIVEQERRKRG